MTMTTIKDTEQSHLIKTKKKKHTLFDTEFYYSVFFFDLILNKTATYKNCAKINECAKKKAHTNAY